MSAVPIASGVSGAVGGRFVPARGDVVFTEYAGRITSLDPGTGALTVLGTGYLEPEDVVTTADGETLFVSERGGRLLKSTVGAADRADSTEVVSGLGALQQLALSGDELTAYAVEHAPGRLLGIDLATGTVTEVLAGLDRPVGLTLDASGATAYVTEQGAGGRLLAVDLGTATPYVLLTGLTAPFFLTWADGTHLLLTERDPADRLSTVDVTTGVLTPVSATPFRPSCATLVPTLGPTTAVVLCDTEIVSVDLLPPVPGCRLEPLAGPLFVGGYARVGYTLTGGLTPDDVSFVVPDGPLAGAVSPSRDATWDDAAPHVVLLGGSEPGTYKVVAVENATGNDLDATEFTLTAEWADQESGPPLAFVGRSEPWVTGGAWGGGGAGPQNVDVLPASGSRRIAIVLVDCSDSRFPATPATAGQRTRWANALLGTTPDPDGVTRSVRTYYREVSEGRFDVDLAGGAVVGPVSLPGSWTDYFSWVADRSAWWANGNYFQAVVTAAQGLLDFDQVDTVVAVMNSLTAPVQMGTTLFSWPVAGGGNLTYTRPGQSSPTQRSMAALNMPVDWDTVDGRRIHETLSHEIGHNLGLPDLYMNVTGFDPAVRARDVGSWDLMSWEDPLPHLSVAAKMMLGWVDPSLVRSYNFATGGGGVDQTLTLQASSALAAPVPAGRLAAVEVRRADGWNYYFEYRRGQGTDIGDRQLPTDGAVFGTDVVSGVFVPPQNRRMIVELANDVDGDGPILLPGLDYEEEDPSGPAHFSLDVLSTSADSAQVRVRYGAGGRPDPSIRPWPGGDVWKSPDIEIRNAKSDADASWLNVPWAGHTNRVVARVTNSGDFPAPGVRVNFFVKDFTIGGAPETGIGSVTHDIPAGATVEFETTWTPPANTPTDDGHYCVVVRIPLYQDPGNPAIVELTELDNLAQSNYTRFISSSASPSARGMSHVALHNPYPERTRMWVVAQQSSAFYRTYVEHQWLWLDPGETQRVGVMYESLIGDPAYDRVTREHRDEIWKRPSRLSLVGLLENPLDEQLHVADTSGGVTVEVGSGRATRIDPFDGDRDVVRGRVVAVDSGEGVGRGAVVVTAQPRGRAKGEASAAVELAPDGRFALELGRLVGDRRDGEQLAVQAEYLGSFGFADSRSTVLWVDR